MTQEFDLGYIRGETGPQGPQGPAGDLGPAGPQGVTPNISIGQVTTVGAGQDAYVTRRGGSPDEAPILDFGLPSASGDMQAEIYDPNLKHQDIFAYCDARSGRRAATRVVAAADSADSSRADFICDGRLDHITINQAIASLPPVGGQVLLLEGSYYLSCYGAEDDDFGGRNLININTANVSLMGQGRGTKLILADNAAKDEADIEGVYMMTVSAAGFLAASFTLEGNSQNNADLEVGGLVLGSTATDACLLNLVAEDCSDLGLACLGDDTALCACVARNCGIGLSLNGGRSQIRACRFSGNIHGVSISSGQHILSECCFYDNSQSGISGMGGQRCRICNNTLWGQPLGISLTGTTDCLISGNLIHRTAYGDGDWGSSEYPLRLVGCLRPHAINNYVFGKAVASESCTGAVLSYSGSDWNPTA